MREADLTRRGLLLVGTAALVAGCSTDHGSGSTRTAPSSTPTPTAPRTTVPGSPSSVRPTSADWSQLTRTIRGEVARPGGSTYDTVRLVENPRYDGARPLAVVTVADGDDVATAIGFARDHGLGTATRSGGHSYPGWSAGDGKLVIDCRALDQVTLTGSTATIGAGAALAPVYDALGRGGRAIAGGSCATVGIGGLTLGGGVGVLTRAMGMTCDAVESMTVVTADGKQVTASSAEHPDLYWALRGGGGGHLGVVTSFTFRTLPAPTVNTVYLTWPFDQAAAVIAAWQDWAPNADPRLWSTLKALGGLQHASGPTLLLSGTWTGPTGSFPRRLDGLLRDVPPPTVRSTHTKSYREAMASYAGCAAIPVARCHTGPGGDLDRQAFGATSHVAYTPLSGSGIETLLTHVEAAQGSGLTEAGISMDALGGRVRDLAPDATAFVHRKALMTVQYTATYAGSRGGVANRYVRGFRSAMVPSWENHAYVNYSDATLPHYLAAYFGANAGRLAQVKQAYDPDDFFAQPQGYLPS